MSQTIEKAYKSSKSIYDDLLTQKSLLGKVYLNLIWGGVDDNKIAETVLSYIPDDFSGTLLDVPIGTAVFTQEKWKSLAKTKAQIIGLDYSEDMLAVARQRLDEYPHITCLQGDVGALPQADASCDIVLSMNGFHVFPDKNKAHAEIYRVLKPGGKFIATFYISGESKLTDAWVNAILVKKGWFTPPFQTLQEVKDGLQGKYQDIQIKNEGSMVLFCCKKEEHNGEPN